MKWNICEQDLDLWYCYVLYGSYVNYHNLQWDITDVPICKCKPGIQSNRCCLNIGYDTGSLSFNDLLAETSLALY